jgi:hypothetical protein
MWSAGWGWYLGAELKQTMEKRIGAWAIEGTDIKAYFSAMFFFLIDSRAMFDASKTKVKTSHEIVCPEFKKYLKAVVMCERWLAISWCKTLNFVVFWKLHAMSPSP